MQAPTATPGAGGGDAAPVRTLTQVHRCRFISYTPVPIMALSFNGSGDGLVLARADASLEYWTQTHPAVKDTATPDTRLWSPIARYPGRVGTTVQCIVWTRSSSSRLFTAGLHGSITEYDLVSFEPKATRESHGGAVWCMAVNADETRLAVGCEDGFVRLFDVSEGSFEYSRSLPGSDGRVLSVGWHPTLPVLFAGSSNASVRGWDLTPPQIAPHPFVRMTLESLGIKKTLVWCVLVQSDMTVVTGDSLGHVQLWDGRLGTRIQSFTAHKQDVMGLAAVPEPGAAASSSFVSCSIDGKVIAYKHTGPGRDTARWILSSSHRGHSHDVRALAVSSTQVIASGGVDSLLCLSSLSAMQSGSAQKIVPYTALIPYVSVANSAHLVMNQLANSLEVFRISEGYDAERLSHVKSSASPPSHVKPMAAPALGLALDPSLIHTHLISLAIKSAESAIVCSAISPDGGWIAYATVSTLRLFKVNASGDVCTVARVPLPTLPSSSRITSLLFSPDSSRLYAATSACAVCVLSLSPSSSSLAPSSALLAVFDVLSGETNAPGAAADSAGEEEEDEEDEETRKPTKGSKRKSKAASSPVKPFRRSRVSIPPAPTSVQPVCVSVMTVSPNGNILAAAVSGSSPLLRLFDAARLKYQATCPRPSSPVSALAFSPDSAKLAVVCVSNAFTLHDSLSGAVDAWSIDNAGRLPAEYLKRASTDPIRYASFHPTVPHRLLLAARGYLFTVNLTPDSLPGEPEPKSRMSSRFRSGDGFAPMLHCGYLGPAGDVITLEMPWLQAAKSLPDPVYRPRFGT